MSKNLDNIAGTFSAKLQR